MNTTSEQDSTVAAHGPGDKPTTTSSWWQRKTAPYIAWKKRFDEERNEWGSPAWRLEMVWIFAWLCILMGAGFSWLTSPHKGWIAWHAPIWLRFLSGVVASASALIALFVSFLTVVWLVYMAKAVFHLPFALLSWARWWEATDARRDHPAITRMRESYERELGLAVLKAVAEAKEIITSGRLTTEAVLDQANNQKLSFDLTHTLNAIDHELPRNDLAWTKDADRIERVQIWRLKKLRKRIDNSAERRPVDSRAMDWIAEEIAAEFDRWSKPLPGLKPVFGRIFAAHQRSFIDQVGPLKQAATEAVAQMKALYGLDERVSKDHPEDFVRGIYQGKHDVRDQSGLIALKKVEQLLGIEGRLTKKIEKIALGAGDVVLAERRWGWVLRDDIDAIWLFREDVDTRHWKRERDRVLSGTLLDDWREPWN